MNELVWLSLRRNRGWPWPEESFGLTPMYGEDGWCRACGVPQVPQIGPLTLQRRNLTVSGAWVPNWRFDSYCAEKVVALGVADRFGVGLRPVAWPAKSPGDAFQLESPVTVAPWFDPDELAACTVRRHKRAGATCPTCGVWRWMPLHYEELPPLRLPRECDDMPLVASPEWFGDGWMAYHQVLVRLDLAEFLVEASPRDFVIKAVN